MSKIKRLLKQTGELRSKSGVDGYGKTEFAAPVSVACRFEQKSKNIIEPDGQQITLHGIVFVLPDVEVKGGDRFDHGGNSYKVITVAEQAGRNGDIHHKELGVQLWRI